VAPAATPTPTEVDVATVPTAAADWHRAKTLPDTVVAVCADAARLPAATPADVNPTTPKTGNMTSGATTAVAELIMHTFVTVELSFHLVPAESAVVLIIFPTFFDWFTVEDIRFFPLSQICDNVVSRVDDDAIWWIDRNREYTLNSSKNKQIAKTNILGLLFEMYVWKFN
jgi:hypothetical protein